MPALKSDKTPEQAQSSLMRLCSRSEKCISDARRLMRRWGIAESDAARIVARLVAERFIDEQRYAAAFVRDKVRFSGWGIHKIRAALVAKGVAKEAVEQALSLLDSSTDCDRLRDRLERKSKSLAGADPYERKTKIIRYGLSLGYDYDTVLGVAEKICKK